MDEFGAQVKKKYEDIEKKEAETRQKLQTLAAEKAPLAAYLIKAGALKPRTRAKRKAGATASTVTPA